MLKIILLQFLALHQKSVNPLFPTNLAVIFAQSNKRVLLIDADLRRGYLHKYFDREPAPGLTELMASKISSNWDRRCADNVCGMGHCCGEIRMARRYVGAV